MSGTLFLRLNEEADPKLLMRLVIETFEDFEANKKKPGAERWTTNTNGRRQLANEIGRRWAEATGGEIEECPWSGDYMIKLWLSWRKATGPDRKEIKHRLGVLA